MNLSLSLLLLLLLAPVLTHDEYYKTLELQRDATAQEIKQAFRKLSKVYHPDRNPGDQVKAARFVEINTAYEVLSDQEKRQIYDIHGEEGLSNQSSQQTDMWGNRRGLQKGPNANSDITVTLEELYNGNNKEFTIKKNVICPICRGTGAKDGKLKKCPKCSGHGVRVEQMQTGMGFTMQMQVTCERCQGKGTIAQGHCTKCHGHKVVAQSKTLKISIEKGSPNGHTIVFPGESE